MNNIKVNDYVMIKKPKFSVTGCLYKVAHIDLETKTITTDKGAMFLMDCVEVVQGVNSCGIRQKTIDFFMSNKKEQIEKLCNTQFPVIGIDSVGNSFVHVHSAVTPFIHDNKMNSWDIDYCVDIIYLSELRRLKDAFQLISTLNGFSPEWDLSRMNIDALAYAKDWFSKYGKSTTSTFFEVVVQAITDVDACIKLDGVMVA